MKTPHLQIPQVFILGMLAVLMAMAFWAGIPLSGIMGDSLVRLVMNGVLVVSMIPMLNAGLGVNFGLPVGICAGLLGLCLAVNLRLTGLSGLFAAMAFSVPGGVLLGYLYGRLLHRVRGREEIAGTFVGFSFISVMNLFWAVAPFTNPSMLWPIGGKGLRPVIGLKGYFAKVLNHAWVVHLGDLAVPVGMLAFFAVLCLGLYAFFRTKTGAAVNAVGENEVFAGLSGVNVRRIRIAAVILSTVLAAWGICVYAQSYGFIELYSAPLMMAFPAASAIFLGGSLGHRTAVVQAVIGTFLFQTTYVISGPIANALLVPEVAEILRMILTNAIILYAMLYEGRRRRAQG
ncbi:MAG TPA: ABC transporter permease [Deltaproteobacteria bacterium]|nr:ABC transporter permease [Deltaproteobacteria bacterium]HPR54661.1 ABC transporter permease [Deltaproteobacteria bacterium]HXK47207.1 ABC transporter permease [Deltaproteobacteria bacterium]